MRYGVLSDIHGNLVALEIALAVLRRQGVDAFLCIGDIVGYGPRPNECVDLVAGLEAVCVAGNHELIALDRLPGARVGRLAGVTMRWTKEVLRDDVREYLLNLPLQVEVPGGIVATHASLHDPQLYVTTPEQADQQLDMLRVEHPGAHLLILGHTHRQWAYSSTGRGIEPLQGRPVGLDGGEAYLLNPGSVGQSYHRGQVGQLSFMVLDADEGSGQFYSIPYHVGRCTEDLRQAGLPLDALHRRPPLLPAPVHRARGALRRRIASMLGRKAA